MRLETWDELEETAPVFCEVCGIQLKSSQDRQRRLCTHCKSRQQPTKNDEAFTCWACGIPITAMRDIATGLCQTCRNSIIRKLNEKHQ